MKAIFSFLLFLAAATQSTGQSKGSLKLYGYQQAVSGGKAPEMAGDTGLRTGKTAGRNYWLYAVSPSRIYPVELWIDGVRFGVSMKVISATPVEHSDGDYLGAAKQILVPKTTQNVVQIIPVSANNQVKANHSSAKAAARSAALVLLYKQNGRFYYQALSQLQTLKAAIMQ